jgi:hypothetical protein
MWIDEAIWGHRLYDEQTPWLVFLEFLNVLTHETVANRALTEPNGYNTLVYCPAQRLPLRNVLFNNEQLEEIRLSSNNESARWSKWSTSMQAARGMPLPNFEYLRQHFQSFDDLCEVIRLIRSTSLEVNSNKRWTSKFVFPYGQDCLYEDLDKNAGSNDRRFFGRAGEIAYLMLCRAKNREELATRLSKRVVNANPLWNSIVRCLQPPDQRVNGVERGGSFLPHTTHPVFDELAEDWINLLGLALPNLDVFPHLVNLLGLHLIRYQLNLSHQVLGVHFPARFVCEVVQRGKSSVRELSGELYQANNVLTAQAVEKWIANIEGSEAWQAALHQENAFYRCKNLLVATVLWPRKPDDYERADDDPAGLLAELKRAALERHNQHAGNVHRNYGREIGLVSRRGTVKLRYAPNDELLKSLIFANVVDRLELNEFLVTIFNRYGLVFGDREAAQALPAGGFEKKHFKANARRLEQRLASLGLVKRLSDGCAYVVNVYRRRQDGQ